MLELKQEDSFCAYFLRHEITYTLGYPSSFIIYDEDDSKDKIKEACLAYGIEKKDKEPFSMVAYQVANTLTENGSVKRGVCDTDGNYLTKLIESKIEHQTMFYFFSFTLVFWIE